MAQGKILFIVTMHVQTFYREDQNIYRRYFSNFVPGLELFKICIYYVKLLLAINMEYEYFSPNNPEDIINISRMMHVMIDV